MTVPKVKRPQELPRSTRLARCIIALFATLYMPFAVPVFFFMDIALNEDPARRLTWKQAFEWWSSWLLMKK